MLYNLITTDITMKAIERVISLKEERNTAKKERIDAIDRLIARYEPALTHQEALYIVKRFES